MESPVATTRVSITHTKRRAVMFKSVDQVAFLFGEGGDERDPQVLGGKGVALAEMTSLGLPVPPGFTLTTSVARAFREEGRLPRRVSGQIAKCVSALERTTGKGFGNPENPLLVSVRSGAAVSMPGMMDTVLNIGLNPATLAGLAHAGGEKFAWDTYRRFLAQFGQTVMGAHHEELKRILRDAKYGEGIEGDSELSLHGLKILCEKFRRAIETETGYPVPDDPEEQLAMAIKVVFTSWNSERAVAYRKAHKIPDWWGTAVNIQTMVFGNLGPTSCTGVVFSRNVATGDPGLYGEFLPEAQGEDVVAGVRTPLPIAEMREWNGELYRELEEHVKMLERHYGDIVDVEFTVENGRLYILQSRRAKRTAEAAVVYAVHRVWDGSLTRPKALESVTLGQMEQLRRKVFNPKSIARSKAIVTGLAASPGAAVGHVAYSSDKAQYYKSIGYKPVLVRKDTSPDDLPGMLVSVAVVTETGGITSHAAVVARGMGLPAVVGTGKSLKMEVREGSEVSVDGTTGTVYFGSLPFTSESARKEVKTFLNWLDLVNGRPVPRVDFTAAEERLSVNVILNDFFLTEAMAASAASVESDIASDAVEMKKRIHRSSAEKMACYLTIAVAGELRYAKEFARWYSIDSPDVFLEETLGVLKREFSLTSGIKGEESRSRVQSGVVGVLKEDPSRIPQFLEIAIRIFSEVRWHSQYGGEPWAKIAEAAHDFLTGKLSHSVFVDHVFDLRHNGDKLFDKHLMFSEKTSEVRLVSQLNDKKRAVGVEELYIALGRNVSFSPEVLDLFARGKDQGLW
jgi:phosphoenolpyruvate synthase/pyruvate phosphate dikinase